MMGIGRHLAEALLMAQSFEEAQEMVYELTDPHPQRSYGPAPKKQRGYAAHIRTEPKILRNDPCPCGSGAKYKKCCMRDNGK